MSHNILLLSDSYKVTHARQYPPNTEVIYSYLESRGGRFEDTTFFGLQYILKKYLEGVQVTQEKIDEAAEIWAAHFGDDSLFNREGWEYIAEEHEGRLPVRIKAVLEGTTVPTTNVLMTIENTDPKAFWLTNYLETLLVQVWYPITVCTQSREIKKVIGEYLKETGDISGLPYKLHDFGFRGVSSVESAGIGGAAHLVNFSGTDTIAAVMMTRKYYGADMPGHSIPSSEHSTITSWGRGYEVNAYKNILDQYPVGMVACVSDSYDIFKACKDLWGGILKDRVLSRDGTLVIRPDSGEDIPAVVCQVLSILGKEFGYEKNSKGFDVLPPQVRIIQGDGVNYESINEVLATMKKAKWSADNIAFGMGGALLQQLHRDTQSFAFKCSAARVEGKWRDVYKAPVNAFGKNSKAGRFNLVRKGNRWQTMHRHDSHKDELVDVFENGRVLVDQSFEEIRKRAR